MLPRHRATSALAAALLAVSLPLSLGSCSGSDDGGGGSGASPKETLAKAKATLDDTSGVMLTLTTDDLPAGVVLAGQALEVPVIAVDGTVSAELPLTTGWQDVDPADYGAPDPAELMNPDGGFSALLAATSGLTKGESVRGGADNREVLTEYSGAVTSGVVKDVIPTATGQFKVVYTISDDGELREARLTGVFYPDSDSMTYSITFDDYGTDKDISAP
jgi:lipoprotein LprG